MIRRFEIANNLGDKVTVLNLGARLVEWETIVNGESRNIIVGYDDIELYREDPCYVGAIAGPFANRIGGGSVTINGKCIKLHTNEGDNILHGGVNALENCMWQLKEQSDRAITLGYWLEDGFNGFPGPMEFEVEYRLAETSSQLKINIKATTEKDTIIGPTGHAYFNLSGTDQTINDHHLQVNASQYTPTDESNIPTGELADVSSTKLDFQTSSQVMDTELDNNYVLNEPEQVAAVLTSPLNDVQLEVSTNYPGIQVYTGEYLESPLKPRQGICLEPQFFLIYS